MKNKGLLAILMATVFLSGCAARTSGRWQISPRFSLTPPLLTLVLINNTTLPLEVFENGHLMTARDPAGQWHNIFVPSGGTVSRGYYNFMGSRQIVLTVTAKCPPTQVAASDEKRNAGCTPGQHMGTDSRSFYLYSGQDYRTEYWEINYLRAPRGSY